MHKNYLSSIINKHYTSVLASFSESTANKPLNIILKTNIACVWCRKLWHKAHVFVTMKVFVNKQKTAELIQKYTNTTNNLCLQSYFCNSFYNGQSHLNSTEFKKYLW